MSDMDVFVPLTVEVKVEGTTVTFGKLKARSFAVAQIALQNVIPALAKDPAKAITHHLDDTLAFVSACCGQPVEWLADQDPDVVLHLLGVAVRVNTDFWNRRMNPAFARLGDTIAGKTPDGEPSSPPLAA